MIEQLRAARWFAGKSRAIRNTHILDSARWVDDASVCLVEVDYDAGAPETYVVAERFDEPEVARALIDRFHGSTVATDTGGSLVFRPTHFFGAMDLDGLEPITPLRGEQSNTSIRFGDALILKLFRRLQYGQNPDVEIGRYLAEHTDFRGTPAVVGSVDYLHTAGESASLALLQSFERNSGDAWTTTLGRLHHILDGADMAESVDAMARLARTTADLHLALASGTGDFAAEPISDDDIAAWQRATEDEVRLAVEALTSRGFGVDTEGLLLRTGGIVALGGALKTRHHGDYHLGQVLERTDGSFAIIDFEGEPARPLAQRREKRSPLRDVAGMLRSFDYARNAALRSSLSPDPDRAHEWYHAARRAFLDAYLTTARHHPHLIPENVEGPLAALELEKAAYEVLYELNNRPDWLPIPLAALTHA